MELKDTDFYVFDIALMSQQRPCVLNDGGMIVYHIDPSVRCSPSYEDDCVDSTTGQRRSPYDGTTTFIGHSSYPLVHAPIQIIPGYIVHNDENEDMLIKDDLSKVLRAPISFNISALNDEHNTGIYLNTYHNNEWYKSKHVLSFKEDTNRSDSRAVIAKLEQLSTDEVQLYSERDLCHATMKAIPTAIDGEESTPIRSLQDEECSYECKKVYRSEPYRAYCQSLGIDADSVGCAGECIVSITPSCEVIDNPPLPCNNGCDRALGKGFRQPFRLSLWTDSNANFCHDQCRAIMKKKRIFSDACDESLDFEYNPADALHVSMCYTRLYGQDQCDLKPVRVFFALENCLSLLCVIGWILFIICAIPRLASSRRKKVNDKLLRIVNELEVLS